MLGLPIAELIWQVGVSDQMFYRWKKKYSGLKVDQRRQMKQLQEENRRLKRIVADITFDKAMLQDVPRKKSKALTMPASGGVFERELPDRLACRVTRMHRAKFRYCRHRDPRAELRMRIREIAQSRFRYGYR